MSFSSPIELFSHRLRQVLKNALADSCNSLQGIRLRKDKPILVTVSGSEWFIDSNGALCNTCSQPLLATAKDLEELISFVTKGSVYAFEQQIREGYVNLPGGHRLGLVGRAVIENGEIKTIRHFSGVNLRVAHQVKGAANQVIPFITRENRRPYHTLIVGPPGSGKTTILRDIARQLSDHSSNPVQVAIADERSEIAGTYQGTPQLEVGSRTDVLDGCPKALAIKLLVRSMSPDVIVTDEIGARGDIDAIEDALRSGVTMITSAHGSSIEEMRTRPFFGDLFQAGAFEKVVILSKNRGAGRIEKVVDIKSNNWSNQRWKWSVEPSVGSRTDSNRRNGVRDQFS